MTDQRRDAGYRGTLPPREDRLARAWVIAVGVVFVLIFVLALAGIPSRLFPEPTVEPFPSVPPLPSASASASASGEPEPEPSGSP